MITTVNDLKDDTFDKQYDLRSLAVFIFEIQFLGRIVYFIIVFTIIW